MKQDIDKEHLDPATGLPKLPAGYFFRFYIDGDGDLMCELRKKGRFFGSQRIKTDWSLRRNAHTYADTKHRMRYLADSVWTTASTEIARKAELASLMGDYPPKSI